MGLVDRLRKTRETDVTVKGYTFTVRRPTPVEAMALQDGVAGEALIRYVIGWSGVKEIDILDGGDPHPIAFDADLAREWLSDRPDLLSPLVEAILDSYQTYLKRLGDAQKN